ncbi:hypothetical protein [Dyella japonica]|uniref:Uncharacterized membrane protein YhaH (DUF805 family) n=1 Tax=Dyella japonica TaxID=231455 RepID=A0ABV2JVC0_9GAMM
MKPLPFDNAKSGRWLVVALALMGLYGYLLPATHYFAAVPGDLGDARFNSIILEHVYRWLVGQDSSLWSPTFFYPYPDTLAFSDNHFGTAWIYALARLAHLSREQAFDLWYCLGSLSTFGCGVYAARRFGFGWFAAAAAAFVFAFSLPSLAQEGHAQLIYRFPIALAVLEGWRMLESRRLHRLPQLGIWIAIQFFCSIYLGLFLLMFLGAMVLIGLVTMGRYKSPLSFGNNGSLKNYALWALAGVLWIGLLLMLAKYHSVARAYGVGRAPEEIKSMLPRLGSYFISDRSAYTAWLGEWVRNVPMRHEHQLFFGLGASVLALCGYVLGRKDPRWSHVTCIFAGVLLVLMAVTLSVGGISLYRFVMILPGFNSIRAVTRVVLVMLLAVGWLCAVGVEIIMRRFATRQTAVAIAIGLALSVEILGYQKFHVPSSQWDARLENLRSRWHPKAGVAGPILFAWGSSTTDEPWLYRELDAMMFAQDAGVATVNGYSGNLPPNFGLPESCQVGAHRLADGALFVGIPSEQLPRLMQRLTLVPASGSCPDYTTAVPFNGPLPDDIFPTISLAIAGQSRHENSDEVIVKITNAGAHYLPALSTDRKPVQLSWQFVPSGGSPDPNGWNTRAPLNDDVPAGSSADQRITVALPTTAGEYRLVLSLVQDNVAWFHDKGMKPFVGEDVIDVPSPATTSGNR